MIPAQIAPMEQHSLRPNLAAMGVEMNIRIKIQGSISMEYKDSMVVFLK